MRVRIATLGLDSRQGRAAASLDDTDVGVKIPWVELDGHWTADVVDAKVEIDSKGVTIVHLSLIAAAEMVLVGADGEVLL